MLCLSLLKNWTGRALGGDPIEITVWGSTLSLRREEARRISVTHADG